MQIEVKNKKQDFFAVITDVDIKKISNTLRKKRIYIAKYYNLYAESQKSIKPLLMSCLGNKNNHRNHQIRA